MNYIYFLCLSLHFLGFLYLVIFTIFSGCVFLLACEPGHVFSDDTDKNYHGLCIAKQNKLGIGMLMLGVNYTMMAEPWLQKTSNDCGG